MASPSDPGGRPITTCPKCQTGWVTAVTIASNFVYCVVARARFSSSLKTGAVLSARIIRAGFFPSAEGGLHPSRSLTTGQP